MMGVGVEEQVLLEVQGCREPRMWVSLVWERLVLKVIEVIFETLVMVEGLYWEAYPEVEKVSPYMNIVLVDLNPPSSQL